MTPIALGYVCSNSSNCRCAHDPTVDSEARGLLMETDAPAILIVDDNEDNRYTLQLMLESDGHSRLATASGGHEALALLVREKFSLVLLDLMMPDLNGEEVLKIHQGQSGYERCFGRGFERRYRY
jgi:PleD family two-component response regulator